MKTAPLKIGILLFDQVTQLDLTAPFEVFVRLPNSQVELVAKTLAPVYSAPGNLPLSPTVTFATAPQFDVVMVPGGSGVLPLLEDEVTLDFLREQAKEARYITSVCTGALVLDAAGLLRGYEATTHWLSLDLLELFGAIPKTKRVVTDRNRITGGGVTAGIDFALTLAAELYGAETARDIQLMMEYNPAPPFDAGSPTDAPAAAKRLRERSKTRQSERREVVLRAAAKLS